MLRAPIAYLDQYRLSSSPRNMPAVRLPPGPYYASITLVPLRTCTGLQMLGDESGAGEIRPLETSFTGVPRCETLLTGSWRIDWFRATTVVPALMSIHGVACRLRYHGCWAKSATLSPRHTSAGRYELSVANKPRQRAFSINTHTLQALYSTK